MDQTALDIPITEVRPRLFVIPSTAPRCWIRADAPADDDGYPLEHHYPTEADFRQAHAEARARQLYYPCVTPVCDRCRAPLADGEYHTTLHLPSWTEAERVARLSDWAIGERGEFICPDHRG